MKQLPSLLLIAAILGAAVWWLRPQAIQLPSDLSLTFTDGSSRQLGELRGRPILVNFWSVNCPVCLQDMPKLAQLHEDLKSQGIPVIAISIPQDPPPLIMAAVEKLAPPYPTALDVRGELSRAFGGIDATPTTLFVDRQGRIVRRIYGELDLTRVRATLTTL